MDNRREQLRRTRSWSSTVQSESDVETTPEEQRFKEQSDEFNARVHDAFESIPIPEGLRDQILAHGKIVPISGWDTRRQFLAIAAALVLLGTLAFLFVRPLREDRTFAGFSSRMVGFAVRQYSMDLLTNRLDAVQAYLAKSGAPADFTLPAALRAAPVIGGAKLSWQGKPVGMVCFSGQSGKTLYMFVIDSANAAVSGAGPEFSTQKRLATAAWSAGGKSFLLAGDVPPDEIAGLVRS